MLIGAAIPVPEKHGNVRRRISKDEIVKLLDSGMTQMQVSVLAGVSRERVRQIDLRHSGRTGRERKARNKLDRAFDRWRSIPFVNAAITRGLSVSPIVSDYGRYSPIACLVSEKVVALRTASRNSRYYRYVHIYRPGIECSFAAYTLPDDLGFLIIPEIAYPRKGIDFAIEEPTGNRRGSLGKRHDWRTYINAWHLLEEK
jgi:hypothetical protein